MSGLRTTWIDHVTGKVTAFVRRGQVLDPAEPLAVHLYAHPDGEHDLRTVLAGFVGIKAHGYVSPLVPPGELRASSDPIDDDRAREVTP